MRSIHPTRPDSRSANLIAARGRDGCSSHSYTRADTGADASAGSDRATDGPAVGSDPTTYCGFDPDTEADPQGDPQADAEADPEGDPQGEDANA